MRPALLQAGSTPASQIRRFGHCYCESQREFLSLLPFGQRRFYWYINVLLQYTTAGSAYVLSRGLLYSIIAHILSIFSLFFVLLVFSYRPPPIPLAFFRNGLQIVALYTSGSVWNSTRICHRRSVVLSFGEISGFPSSSHDRFPLPRLREGR